MVNLKLSLAWLSLEGSYSVTVIVTLPGADIKFGLPPTPTHHQLNFSLALNDLLYDYCMT